MIIKLNLDEEIDLEDDKIVHLSELITSDIDEDNGRKLSVYFEKLIDRSLKSGHGNLIGVIKDNQEAIEKLKNSLDDGVYLDQPIDFGELISLLDSEKTSNISIRLKSYSTLMSGMLNHDGITLFSTKGRLLGYHLFIKDDHQANPQIVGGARSRAFESMKNLGFKACFYKSQDGNIKFFEHE